MTDEEQTPPEPLDPDTEPTEATTQAQPEEEGPSRFGGMMRWLLRWAVVVGVVFLLGVMATWIVRVSPQSDTIRSLSRSLDESRNQVNELQQEVETLRGLEDENEQLTQELETKDRHLDLLAVLVDVTRAQLALAEDQPGEASAELEGTDDRLASLESGLEGSEADVVSGMRDRLNLVLNELETDEFAAQRDLEILANNLVDLERTMFGDG